MGRQCLGKRRPSQGAGVTCRVVVGNMLLSIHESTCRDFEGQKGSSSKKEIVEEASAGSKSEAKDGHNSLFGVDKCRTIVTSCVDGC
jgi:glucokinase